MSTTSQRVYIPARLQRQGRLLLNQQCWLWGQDVRCASENLLLSCGFERMRAPEDCSGSSQYTKMLGGGRLIRLWGFGMFYGAIEGIYIHRYDFLPRVTCVPPDAWQKVDDMHHLEAAQDTVLLREAVLWIANYERWVLECYGHDYRVACLGKWTKRSVPAKMLPAAWDALASDLESC